MAKRNAYAFFVNAELIAVADGLEQLGRAFAAYVSSEIDDGEADLGSVTVEVVQFYDDGEAR